MPYITQWGTLCPVLDEYYEIRKQYFYQQLFSDGQFIKPLIVLPGFEGRNNFYTKVHNIMIVSEPFGWSPVGEAEWDFDWPPGSEEEWLATIRRHLLTFDRYAYYQSDIWMDFIPALAIRAGNPRSDILYMMYRTEEQIIETCRLLPGFEYKGRIMTSVDQNLFTNILNPFYGVED